MSQIRADIINQVPYSQISKKYNISIGYISQINNGTRFHDDNYTYPLAEKICNDDSYVAPLLYDLLFTNLSSIKLGEKYGKAKATITAINVGRNRKNPNYLYPLRDNLQKNQKIYNSLNNIVSTISGETESNSSIDTSSETV